MARKRSIFFRTVQSILKSVLLRKRYQKQGLIFLALLTLVSTLIVPALLSEQVLGKESKNSHYILISQAEDALVLEQKGKEYYDAGRFAEAVEVWQQAANAYDRVSNADGKTQSLINIAEALQALGFYSRSCQTLLQAFEIKEPADCKSLTKTNQNQQKQIELLINSLTKLPNSVIKANGLLSFGNVFQRIGELELSQKVLNMGLQSAKQLGNSELESSILLSLGNTEKILSISILNINSKNPIKEAIDIHSLAESNNLPEGVIGNVIEVHKQAIEYYKKAASLSMQPLKKIQAENNHLNLLLYIKQWWAKAIKEASIKHGELSYWRDLEAQLNYKSEQVMLDIQSQISNLPETHDGLYAKINFAQSFIKLRSTFSAKDTEWPQEIAFFLSNVVKQARNLKDNQVEAYALGYLGELYEKQALDPTNSTQKNLLLAQAKNFTEQCLKLLSSDPNSDNRQIIYRWEWQLGRILKVQGNNKAAKAAYDAAFQNLKSLRMDLSAIPKDVQFYFQDEVEPVYREYIGLLLESEERNKEDIKKDDMDDIKKARNVIEFLQLAELDNYFQNPCVETKQVDIDEFIDKQAQTSAVIYPIILSNSYSDIIHLAIIVKLPKEKKLFYYSKVIGKNDFETTKSSLDEILYKQAVEYSRTKEPEKRNNQLQENKEKLLPVLKKMYEWLIQPIKADLAEVKTLVFVLDSQLQNIPIAALYDGEKYLVQEYSIALTPSLQLTDPQPLQGKLEILAAGIGIAIENQPGRVLPAVDRELNEIKKRFPNRTTLLKDQNFTKQKFSDQLTKKSFSVVHLATHGEFSSNPNETYIQAIDGRILGNELDTLLRDRDTSRFSTLELLVLSACETAEGDRRAVLGLAGIAVRAGTRSTLATLWKVEDKSAANLMSSFYKNLVDSPKMSKAELLHTSQLSLLESQDYNHPVYWAAYVLVGNWL